MAGDQAEGTPSVPKSSEELIAALEEKMKGFTGDEKGAIVTLYGQPDDKKRYVEVVTDPSLKEGPEMMMTVLADGEGAEKKMDMGLVVKMARGETPVSDWAALYQDVVTAKNTQDVVVELKVVGGMAADRADTSRGDVKLRVFVQGVPVTIASEALVGMKAPYYDKSTVTIAAFGDEPLLTLTSETTETDEKPVLPDVSQYTLVDAATLMDEKGEPKPEVQQILMQAMPTLMQNLQTALPEEFALVMIRRVNGEVVVLGEIADVPLVEKAAKKLVA